METVEVVIKIPKDMYERTLCTGVVIVGIDAAFIGGAISDGTVLPKGHGRLGDLDGIIKRHCFVECKGTPDCQSECEFFDRINDAPTVIEADKDGNADG